MMSVDTMERSLETRFSCSLICIQVLHSSLSNTFQLLIFLNNISLVSMSVTVLVSMIVSSLSLHPAHACAASFCQCSSNVAWFDPDPHSCKTCFCVYDWTTLKLCGAWQCDEFGKCTKNYQSRSNY